MTGPGIWQAEDLARYGIETAYNITVHVDVMPALLRFPGLQQLLQDEILIGCQTFLKAFLLPAGGKAEAQAKTGIFPVKAVSLVAISPREQSS